jgi:hypothetical protein
MKFYIEDHGEGPEDAREIPSNKAPYPFCEKNKINQVADPRIYAELAAEYCHNHRDGWEWCWPITFTIVSDDGTEANVEVERENVPQFSGYIISQKGSENRK